MISEEEQRKREERERKKAEVRARLEAQSAAQKKQPSKKGFMTGERKKKLRALLRRKAAEELKRQQEAKANERRQVISERTGAKPNLDEMREAELAGVCKALHARISELEADKWELEHAVARRELEIVELSSQVSDNRGRFVRPPLRRVPKYEQKIERMLLNARKEVGFTVTLKAVKRDQFKVDEAKDSKEQAPEWSWKKSPAAREGAEEQ